jgi:hypothetical protein
MIITGMSKFGIALCLALGEDPKLVKSININSFADAAVTAIIEKYVTDETGEKITHIIQKYIWAENAEQIDR